MNGPSWERRATQVRIAEDAYRRAQQEADRLFISAWNGRMMLMGGPTEPSPTIGVARAHGYRFLRVRCGYCRTSAAVALDNIPRPPETRLGALEPVLMCLRCREDGFRGRRARIMRLSRTAQE